MTEPRDPTHQAAAANGVRKLPAGIWILGSASLFMDLSSEAIHSVLPVFMTGVLGASFLAVGVLEGVAEATAAVTKLVSGTLSDRQRRRKPLLVTGYALAALTKPLFPLATSMLWVFTARFLDRIGKGIRGAPRDALIADITPPAQRGAAYGLRQALDSVGAFLGPVLAIALLAAFHNDMRAVMWVAIVPALITVGLLVVGIREPETTIAAAPRPPLGLAMARRLPRAYWIITLLGATFTLARFSEAFLILRAQDVGLTVGQVPFVMVVMNVVYAGLAYPAGAAADRWPKRTPLLLGLVLLVAADLTLALATSPTVALIGAALWGAHMAATQGVLAKLVADAAPTDLRGTAFGVFNLVSGAALLLASVIAGALWQTFGPATTFLAGAGFAAVTAVGLLVSRR